jgi:hypothetical protein
MYRSVSLGMIQRQGLEAGLEGLSFLIEMLHKTPAHGLVEWIKLKKQQKQKQNTHWLTRPQQDIRVLAFPHSPGLGSQGLCQEHTFFNLYLSNYHGSSASSQMLLSLLAI